MTKKDRLFQQKDITKWDIAPEKLKDLSKDALASDRKLAFDNMLPRVKRLMFHFK